MVKNHLRPWPSQRESDKFCIITFCHIRWNISCHPSIFFFFFFHFFIFLWFFLFCYFFFSIIFFFWSDRCTEISISFTSQYLSQTWMDPSMLLGPIKKHIRAWEKCISHYLVFSINTFWPYEYFLMYDPINVQTKYAFIFFDFVFREIVY